MKHDNLFNRSLMQISAILLIALSIVGTEAAALRPKLISQKPDGTAGNSQSGRPVISADGRYLAFESGATDLVPGLSDNNGSFDVFVRDLQTGELRCVSRRNGTMTTGNDRSNSPKISDDGRYIVFESRATDLAPNDTNAGGDIFRYDMQTDQLATASLNVGGTAAGDAHSFFPDLSADGRHVIFTSFSTNLITVFVDGNTSSAPDIFMRDMQTGTTKMISARTGSPALGGNGLTDFSTSGAYPYKIVNSGGHVIFSSTSSNLVTGVPDMNAAPDVFVRETETFRTVCVSVNMFGNATGDGSSIEPNISEDGRRAFFTSAAENLVSNDTNDKRDVFMRDLQTGATELVSLNAAGTNGGNESAAFQSTPITPDGRFVAFVSFATNLVPGFGYTPNTSNIFVRDLQTGVTRLVSVDSTGTAAANASPSLSRQGITGDGRFIGFSSTATNLVPEDADPQGDIYVRDTKSGKTTLLSLNFSGTGGSNINSQVPVVARNGRRAAFESGARNLSPNDSNNFLDVYLADSFGNPSPAADFDGDGKSDLSVYRPQLNGQWFVLQSINNLATYRFWGAETDLIAPADYNGDGYTEYAVYRPSNGTWYISDGLTFATQEIRFGAAGDKPVPADYDGDGKADIAVFRPSNGLWYIRRSSDGAVDFVPFGLADDVPVLGDFDGDARNDVAVFRPSTGVWHVLRSSDGSYFAVKFGLSGDKTVPADYDNDGKTDIAVFRSGTWYILQSLSNQVGIINWGLGGDMPVPGNYDRDGRADLAVFRPSEGNWYVFFSSSSSYSFAHFGQPGDRPAPAAFIP